MPGLDRWTHGDLPPIPGFLLQGMAYLTWTC